MCDQVNWCDSVAPFVASWVGQVELAKTDQVAAAEALAVTQAQVGGQVVDQRLAVLGPYLAGLFELDDVAPHLPVGLDIQVGC